ncbi:MAG: glutamine amidotransferase [Proteobacteria bacterium]|nr:MAG: glutamine amidotransferase [Pseudomonadota bacterium]
MKPIAIFRHYITEGPGYFATYLDRHSLPWVLIKLDEGESVPSSADRYAGLVFMGGPMSVNDKLPWISPVLALIDQAVARDVPVLGHCLGGQLMSKALGGTVARNPVHEIGWGRVHLSASAQSSAWFGAGRDDFTSFHWHGETFSIPDGATRLLSSEHCVNQAFALGKHLGMQCHIEMTAELVQAWCRTGAREIERHAGPAVQPVAAVLADLEQRLAELHTVADAVYGKWTQGLDR